MVSMFLLRRCLTLNFSNNVNKVVSRSQSLLFSMRWTGRKRKPTRVNTTMRTYMGKQTVLMMHQTTVRLFAGLLIRWLLPKARGLYSVDSLRQWTKGYALNIRYVLACMSVSSARSGFVLWLCLFCWPTLAFHIKWLNSQISLFYISFWKFTNAHIQTYSSSYRCCVSRWIANRRQRLGDPKLNCHDC